MLYRWWANQGTRNSKLDACQAHQNSSLKVFHYTTFKFITSIFNFLQPRFHFLIPVQQCFFRVTYGLVSIGHARTTIPKTTKVIKVLLCFRRLPIDFHIWYPRLMHLPSISGMNYIVPCLTNVRQPLKCFHRLAVSLTVFPSRDCTHSICFQTHCPEHLISMICWKGPSWPI